MTTKVVKGSLWTLAGQVLPMAASFVATPFVIRFLGAEAYGVLLLVGLVPMYFSFADLGMGIASTKFASEAYGDGDSGREADAVWTAATVAFAGSAAIALPLFLLSGVIVRDVFAVQENLQFEASLALKFSAVTFLLGSIANVMNSPLLSRLRMDLTSSINAGSKLVAAFSVPIVLYFGGGVAGAALSLMVVSFVGVAILVYVSGRFLREIYTPRFATHMLKPLLVFGAGLLMSSIATAILVNSEKLLLTRLVSVKSLAYYSVAATLAGMATMFSWAMVQSLIPAFSQLLKPGSKGHFDSLFSRSLRLTIIALLPILMGLFVSAEPFFTYWAGEDFGRESSLPFYLLLLGLTFNVISYVPYSALLAAGKSDVLAKLYWIEVVPYVVLAVILINSFGIAGAALAWSTRVAVDSVILSLLARRIIDAAFDLRGRIYSLGVALAVLLLPIAFVIIFGNFSVWLLVVAPLSAGLYLLWMWRTFLIRDEKEWLEQRARATLRTLGLRSR